MVLACLAGSLWNTGAARAAEPSCHGIDPAGQARTIALARIGGGEPRIHFLANPAGATPQCPAVTAGCRKKAFLVAGDDVLVRTGQGDFLCATFKSRGGAETDGWLPAPALNTIPSDPAPRLADWTGHWVRDEEGSVTLSARGGGLAVAGDATFGARDPDRVRRGAVNLGTLEGSGRPRGNVLALGPGYDGTVPPPASSMDCLARLRLFGRYLVVDDNRQCGGMNVSFTGIYVRAAR
jgi:hypothetical protein